MARRTSRKTTRCSNGLLAHVRATGDLVGPGVPPHLEDLQRWMTSPRESERLEFKEARHSYDREKLVRYCAALANEGGGHLILGVTDRPPRRVIGTSAYPDLGVEKYALLQRLRLRVDAHELAHADGRVIVFTVPSRPLGMPVVVGSEYLMRSGESLVAMSPDQLKRILDETVPDFSATVCDAATVSDLADTSVARSRHLWEGRQPCERERTPEQLLEDAGLLVGGHVTIAALILLGTTRALGRHLAQCEIIFEYRGDDAVIAAEQRVELRQGFLAVDDELWRLVSLRNTVFQFVQGLFRTDIPAFNERAFREALLNAVCHRDYRFQGSIFVRQSPTKIEITSPGGFPPGITVDNILFRQLPRNRCLAEAFQKCGLVERSGQGADLLFETAVREGKLPLDYSGTDDFQVPVDLAREGRRRRLPSLHRTGDTGCWPGTGNDRSARARCAPPRSTCSGRGAVATACAR